jgi:hypothetical protein
MRTLVGAETVGKTVSLDLSSYEEPYLLCSGAEARRSSSWLPLHKSLCRGQPDEKAVNQSAQDEFGMARHMGVGASDLLSFSRG